MKKKVLIVDDSMYMRALIKIAVEEAGYEVVGEAADGKTTLELAKDLQPDIITLDNILPDMIGLDIMDRFNNDGMKFKVLMISAMGQNITQEEARKKGIDDYIVKPFEINELVDKINQIAAIDDEDAA